MKNHHEHPEHTKECMELLVGIRSLIPVLSTARLELVAPRIEDFSHYAEIIDNDGHFIMEVPGREAAWLDFMQMIATWVVRGYGLWTVQDKRSEDCVGFALIGFEPGDHEPELGYFVVQSKRGKGYAVEAATAVKDFAFQSLGFKTLVSTIDSKNLGSCAVAEKIGGVRDDDAEVAHNHEVLVYRYRK